MGATTIISTVGLLFAAVAAWGAWMTVRLTHQIRHEANLRRMIDALLTVEHAAEGLAVNESNAERQERFRAAQRELVRAGVLPFIASAPIADLRGFPRLLGSLTADDAAEQPREVAANAKSVVVTLSREPPLTRMQRWWLGFRWFVVRVRHPRSWRDVDELRRGWASGPGAGE